MPGGSGSLDVQGVFDDALELRGTGSRCQYGNAVFWDTNKKVTGRLCRGEELGTAGSQSPDSAAGHHCISTLVDVGAMRWTSSSGDDTVLMVEQENSASGERRLQSDVAGSSRGERTSLDFGHGAAAHDVKNDTWFFRKECMLLTRRLSDRSTLLAGMSDIIVASVFAKTCCWLPWKK